MIDLHLKAADEPTARAALPFFVDETGHWLIASHDHALDPIGPLTITPATLAKDGTIATPPTIDPAFHLNLRLFGAGEALATAVRATGLAIEPANPRRLWAG